MLVSIYNIEKDRRKEIKSIISFYEARSEEGGVNRFHHFNPIEISK